MLNPVIEKVIDDQPAPLSPQISASLMKVSKKMSFNARGSISTRKSSIAKIASNSVANVASQVMAHNSLSKNSSAKKLANVQPIVIPPSPETYIKEVYKFSHFECLWMWSKCNFEVLFAKLSYQNEKCNYLYIIFCLSYSDFESFNYLSKRSFREL